LIALVLFPVTMRLLNRASASVDGVTLLAAYHTAYNVVGVAVLLPLIDRFTRLVERILPERRSPLTRCLDPAALVTPFAAEEAVRRTVARALGAICGSIREALTRGNDGVSLAASGDALRQAREFMSEVCGPPQSEEEHARLTRTLHALDDASRLAGIAAEKREWRATPGASEDAHAIELCTDVMRNAVVIADGVGAMPGTAVHVAAAAELGGDKAAMASTSTEPTMARLEQGASSLRELQGVHRAMTLGAVAGGLVSADEAMTRVDAVRQLDALAHHAWQSAAHLVDGGA
jgi:phosphate:Na+ symporter